MREDHPTAGVVGVYHDAGERTGRTYRSRRRARLTRGTRRALAVVTLSAGLTLALVAVGWFERVITEVHR